MKLFRCKNQQSNELKPNLCSHDLQYFIALNYQLIQYTNL